MSYMYLSADSTILYQSVVYFLSNLILFRKKVRRVLKEWWGFVLGLMCSFFFFHIGFDVFFVIGGVFFIKNLYEIIPIHLLSTN